MWTVLEIQASTRQIFGTISNFDTVDDALQYIEALKKRTTLTDVLYAVSNSLFAV
jgi:hypothetical protein